MVGDNSGNSGECTSQSAGGLPWLTSLSAHGDVIDHLFRIYAAMPTVLCIGKQLDQETALYFTL